MPMRPKLCRCDICDGTYNPMKRGPWGYYTPDPSKRRRVVVVGRREGCTPRQEHRNDARAGRLLRRLPGLTPQEAKDAIGFLDARIATDWIGSRSPGLVTRSDPDFVKDGLRWSVQHAFWRYGNRQQ